LENQYQYVDAHLILQGIANGLTLGCLIGLLAVGYSLVYGVARLINFAHGDLFTLSGYYILFFLLGDPSVHSANLMFFIVATSTVTAFAWGRKLRRTSARIFVAVGSGILATGVGTLLIGRNIPILLAVLAATLLISAAGVAFEYLVYRPLEGSPRLGYLVAAIGLSLSLQGLMQLLFGTERRSFPPSVSAQLSALPVPGFLIGYFSGLDLLIISFTAAITVVASWLAKSSRFGIAIRATADDPILAARFGIDVRQAKMQVFAVGSASWLHSGSSRILRGCYWRHRPLEWRAPWRSLYRPRTFRAAAYRYRTSDTLSTRRLVNISAKP
jgi:branched-chain amino acid transport system permease protein